MAATLDLLMDQYERGQINRRQLMKGLTIAVAGALGATASQAQAAGAALAPAMSLNHVHIYVKDMKRTQDFYSSVLGATPKAAVPKGPTTMQFPGAKPGSFGSWLSITQIADPNTPPRIDHVGYGVTIPTSEFDRIGEELKKRWPETSAPRVFITEYAGKEIYFKDPDGLNVQLIQIDHSGELSGYDKQTGAKIAK